MRRAQHGVAQLLLGVDQAAARIGELRLRGRHVVARDVEIARRQGAGGHQLSAPARASRCATDSWFSADRTADSGRLAHVTERLRLDPAEQLTPADRLAPASTATWIIEPPSSARTSLRVRRAARRRGSARRRSCPRLTVMTFSGPTCTTDGASCGVRRCVVARRRSRRGAGVEGENACASSAPGRCCAPQTGAGSGVHCRSCSSV